MIRYKNSITFRRNASGMLTITGDKMAVSYKTRAINGYEYVRQWWEMQHQSSLRSYQKDLLVKLLPSAFKDLDWRYEHAPYVIYADGAGYNQPHDMTLVTLKHPENPQTIYVFGTAEHTWVHSQPTTSDKFTIHVEDALGGSVDTKNGQDCIWDLYDGVRAQAQQEQI